MEKKISRRGFIGASAVGFAGMTLAGLAGCSAPASSTDDLAATGKDGSGNTSAELPRDLDMYQIKDSIAEIEPITEFEAEESYDIVVVGAGTAGTLAVLTALDEGATVCCLQKESTPVAHGNGSAGIIRDASTDAGILRWMQSIRKMNNYRVNWDLFKFFTTNSGETLCWLDKKSEEAGYPASAHSAATVVTYDNGDVCALCTHNFGVKPENNGNLVKALCDMAEKQGAVFHYSTPGVQLVVDNGAVTGVIGKTSTGYIKVNANKAVIVATGDYQNNQAMVERFCPDVKDLARKQQNKTGDGHIMSIMAGGHMVNVGHAHMVHDADSAGNGFSPFPLLCLNANGERFMNEEMSMPTWNEGCRANINQDDPGVFVRLFDSNYPEYYPKAPAAEDMQMYIPGAQENPTGVYKDLIDTHVCDTLDELAEELRVPADALKKSVARWNELCEQGSDVDFGLAPENLHPIDTPPYWGIRQWVRVTAINGGVAVDGNYQAIDADNNPIPGLFVVGTTGGDLCGGPDWNMGSGVSCGHVMTSGRYATIYALNGNWEPSNPVSWDEVKDSYTDGMHDTAWVWQR